MEKSLKSILTSHVITVSPNIELSAAVALMSQKKISCLVIVENGHPQGIFTEKDLIFLTSQKINLMNTDIKEVMVKPVITVNENTLIQTAYQLLEKNKIRHLVVVDNQSQVVGVVTQTNIINNLGLECFIELKNISRIMSDKVVVINQNLSITDAVIKMAELSISCLVVSEGDFPVGIISERDIVNLFQNKTDFDRTKISSVMTKPVKTINFETSAHEAAYIMHQEKVRRLVVIDNQGKLIGIVTQYDIIKNFEEKYVDFLRDLLKKKDEKLLETKKSLDERIILENILNFSIDMAIVATDLNFNIEFFNPAAESIYGFQTSEVIGRCVNDIHQQKNIESGRFIKAIEKVKSAGEYNYSFSMVKKGVTHHYASRIFGIKDKKKQLAGYVLMSSDITEKKQSDEMILKVNQALLEKSETLQRFHNVTVNRELEMVKLKEEVNLLLNKLGEAAKYESPQIINHHQNM